MLHRVQKRGGVPPSSFVYRATIVAAALALAALLSALGPLSQPAVAQSPTPTGVIAPADPRTDPGASSLTGAPVFAAVAVLALGGVAALATFVYVRLVSRR